MRLVDISGSGPKREKLLEAIQSPNCGYFYQADATTFHDIPGSPIAYWAGSGLLDAFADGNDIRRDFYAIVKGIFTGDNARFLRYWHEVSRSKVGYAWKLYAKGGPFRRWSGNIEHVINWDHNAEALRSFSGSGLGASKYFGCEILTWSKITSSLSSFRYANGTVYFDDASPALVIRPSDTSSNKYAILALLNSAIVREMLSIIAPTLNCQVGDVSSIPVLPIPEDLTEMVTTLTAENIELSSTDWDLQETSWGFMRNSLV